MLRAYLDEESFDTRNLGPSLGHVVEAARSRCASEGRVLVEILLNSEPISPEEMSVPVLPPDDDDEGDPDDPSAEVGDDDDVLRMMSADPYDLVVETTEQAIGAIDNVINLQSETSELIQEGKADEALPRLSEIIEIWQQLQQCLHDGAALVEVDLEQVRSEEESVDGAIRSLTHQLAELKVGLMNQDWVLIADCLGYELEPVAEQWRALLERFIEIVQAQREESGGDAAAQI